MKTIYQTTVKTQISRAVLAAICGALVMGTCEAGSYGIEHHSDGARSGRHSDSSQHKQHGHRPTSSWLGASYETWTERNWKWFMSIPRGVGPWNDATGAQCGINQSGPVWFIGGPVGSDFTRSCTIPPGKAIAVPIIDYINDYPCPAPPPFEPAAGQSLEDFLLKGVKPLVDGFTVHTATLDGQPLQERRVTSGLFGFTGAKDLTEGTPSDPCVTGSPQLGVSDGYFVFIEPLAPGHHTLILHSENPTWDNGTDTSGNPKPPGQTTTGTYELNITK